MHIFKYPSLSFASLYRRIYNSCCKIYIYVCVSKVRFYMTIKSALRLHPYNYVRVRTNGNRWYVPSTCSAAHVVT